MKMRYFLLCLFLAIVAVFFLGCNGAKVTDIVEDFYATPNPFTDSVKFVYTPKHSGYANLVVYGSDGSPVINLINQDIEAGKVYKVDWDGKNGDGNEVGGGMYLCKLTIGDGEKSIKILKD